MAKHLEHKIQFKKDGRIIISNPAQGFTVLAVRDGQRMVRFSTAWCSPADKFKRKVGKRVAEEKFAIGETMVAPLAEMDDHDISFYLEEATQALSGL